MDINNIMRELAEYTRIAEETAAIIDGLKDSLKAYMDAHGVEILTGEEHKATYKVVVGTRVDTTALKKDMPEVVAAYTKRTETKRFTFA
jgi:predicted phage-related endonuclease